MPSGYRLRAPGSSEAKRRGAAGVSLAVSVESAHTPATTGAASTGGELSADAKSALVLRVLRGESLGDVARSAGVDDAQLAAWQAAFLDGAVARLAEG